MDTINIDDPFEKLISLGRKRKPLRIKIHEQQFILLPNMSEDILEKLEDFLEDHADELDKNLKAEISERRKQILNDDYISHDDIWQESK